MRKKFEKHRPLRSSVSRSFGTQVSVMDTSLIRRQEQETTELPLCRKRNGAHGSRAAGCLRVVTGHFETFDTSGQIVDNSGKLSKFRTRT
jgi:hypothetical protein